MNFLVSFLSNLIFVLELAILGRVIVSWVDPQNSYAISRFLRDITEPIIGPIRRILPSAGMFDFAPMVALILLAVLQAIVGSVVV